MKGTGFGEDLNVISGERTAHHCKARGTSESLDGSIISLSMEGMGKGRRYVNFFEQGNRRSRFLIGLGAFADKPNVMLCLGQRRGLRDGSKLAGPKNIYLLQTLLGFSYVPLARQAANDRSLHPPSELVSADHDRWQDCRR